MKKILSTATLFIFLIAAFTGITVQAAAPEPTTINTDVIIHKIQSEVFPNGTITNPDGAPLSVEELSENLGTKVTFLDGVTFSAYRIEESTYYSYIDGPASIPATPPESEAVWTGTTSNGGQVVWQKKVTVTNGVVTPEYYVVYETKRPEEISDSLAVPFVIGFPITNKSGDGYLNSINIYPKNITGTYPLAAKDILRLGNNTGSFDIGQVFPVILKGTIPSNIQNYSVYTLSDTLDTALTYTGGTEVYAGSTLLDPKTDYTLDTTGQTISVALTKTGIGKVAASIPVNARTKFENNQAFDNTIDGNFIKVRFNAKINGNAPMGSPISNTAKLTFNNGSFATVKDTESSDKIEITTGGQTFTKVNPSKATLAGAEFLLQEDGENMLWSDDLIAANKATGDNKDKFVNPVLGEPIKLVSDASGLFEFKGLAYSALGNTNEGIQGPSSYTLKETKAPEGYQLLGKIVPFEVNARSFENNLEIENRTRPVIPATGGIGTLIFLVVGSALMFLAYKGYKRQTAK